MLLDEGWLAEARRVPSPHYDCRPDDENPSLLVVHNISLPPGMLACRTIKAANAVMISQLVLSWKGRIRWPIPMRSISNWQP